MNNNYNKKIIACILTYKPDIKFINLIKKLLCQSIQLDKIVIINTEESLFYQNLDEESILYIKNLDFNDKISIVHIDKSDFDHGRTRNFGFSMFESDYIVYITQDAVPVDNTLIFNLLESFNDNKTALSYARQVPFSNAKFTEKLVREFNYPEHSIVKNIQNAESLGIKNYFSSNVCCMYDSEIFKALGKFDENIILNEDSLFAYKAINNGYNVIYNSNALVYHSHDLSYVEQFKRNLSIGKSQRQFDFIYRNVNNEKEGIKLFKYVCYNCLIKMKIISLLDFIIETVFRYTGFIIGKRLSKNV